jgi:hypothetical protein
VLGFMRSIALFLLLSIFSVCFSHEVTRTYDFSYLREFAYHGPGKIEIKQGEKNELTLTADPELLNKTYIKEKKGILTISPKDEFFAGRFPGIINGTLKVKDLSKITLSGSISVDIDKLKGNQLMINMELEGSSLIEGLLEFNRIAVSIKGSSEAVLKGKVYEQIVYIDGAGMYEGKSLESKKALVHIRGAGTAIINATEELTATVTGYGHVHYIHNFHVPKILNKKVRGKGEISPYKEDLFR